MERVNNVDYDFSKPYRTVKWLEEVKNRELKIPLCIPSYKRPHAPIFSKRSKIFPYFDPRWVYVFIRKEDYEDYKFLEGRVTLMILPETIKELGMTRDYIMQWAYDTGYENIFMFDDRFLSVFPLAPRLTKNGKLILAVMPNSDPYETLKMWEYLHTKVYYPTTISNVMIRGREWYPVNINKEIKPNGGGGAFMYYCINVRDCLDNDVRFKNVYEWGLDDVSMTYRTLLKGLPVRQFTDMAYLEVHGDLVHAKSPSPSGSNATMLGHDRESRLQAVGKLFCEKILGGANKYNGIKVPGLRFVDDYWTVPEYSRYWVKYYQEHGIK